MTDMPERRKKLIETGIPLTYINEQSSREKSLRHGLPSTLHLYWARRPGASCSPNWSTTRQPIPTGSPLRKTRTGNADACTS